MKKYPVTYKGQIYEVRWKEDFYTDYLYLYKVSKIFNIKKLKFIGRVDITKIKITTPKDDPNYYIEQIKELFRLYEEDIKQTEIESIKQRTLFNWDGIL